MFGLFFFFTAFVVSNYPTPHSLGDKHMRVIIECYFTLTDFTNRKDPLVVDRRGVQHLFCMFTKRRQTNSPPRQVMYIKKIYHYPMSKNLRICNFESLHGHASKVQVEFVGIYVR